VNITNDYFTKTKKSNIILNFPNKVIDTLHGFFVSESISIFEVRMHATEPNYQRKDMIAVIANLL
jgi:hypothetical protein